MSPQPTTSNLSPIPHLGLGLRSEHLSFILESKPKIGFFEILIDNYLEESPLALRKLDEIAATYPLTFHSVAMNLGGLDDLDETYIRSIAKLAERYNPLVISDHVCFSAHGGKQHHDLLPLPYTKESLQNICQRIEKVQSWLNQPIAIENPSSYLSYRHNEMGEAEFMASIPKASGCRLILDANNIYVSAKNHGFDALKFAEAIDPETISYIHLAGFEDRQTYLLDSHSRPVHDRVWSLYRQMIERWGVLPTMVEWDNDIPDFETVLAEISKAGRIQAEQQ